MINLKIPKIVLRKKTRALRKDRFVFTYEYGWSESADMGNSKEHKSTKVTDAALRIAARCSWSDVTISFPK
jgi:hypothetical protein